MQSENQSAIDCRRAAKREMKRAGRINFRRIESVLSNWRFWLNSKLRFCNIIKRHQEIIHATTGIVDILIFLILLGRFSWLSVQQIVNQQAPAHLLRKDGQQKECGQAQYQGRPFHWTAR